MCFKLTKQCLSILLIILVSICKNIWNAIKAAFHVYFFLYLSNKDILKENSKPKLHS